MREPTHSRVTAEGQTMGAISTRMAEVGRRHLELLGLANVEAPALRGGMCTTCACQAGSVPNGCLQTQMDFLKCVIEGKPFLCHAPRDGKLCAGWVRARASIGIRPPPVELVEMVARWEYSPPDDKEASDGLS